MNKFVKGLIALLIGTLATAVAVQGATWVFYLTSAIGAVVVYFAQNAFIKPVSIFGTIDMTDFIKGLMFAVGTSIAAYASSVITAVHFDWLSFWEVIKVALVTYLGKNALSNSAGNIGFEKR